MLMRRGLEPGCNRLSLCFPQSQDEAFIQLELLEGECWQEGGRYLAPFPAHAPWAALSLSGSALLPSCPHCLMICSKYPSREKHVPPPKPPPTL